MLLLVGTTDILQVITGQAVTVDAHASYSDINTSTGVVTPGRTNSKISTATTTNVVAAPGANVIRNVKSLWIENVHASTPVDITVQHTDGTNVVRLEKLTLQAGESLHYNEGAGWEYNDANGIPKANPIIVIGNQLVRALASDLTNATTTAAKVTGLDLALGVGSWIFEYFIVWRSDTTTTGVKFGCNFSGTVTFFDYVMEGTAADITTNTAVMDQDVLLTTGSTKSAWAARTKTTTAPMIAAGVDTINVDLLMRIEGIAVVTVAGNLELYHASEAATTTTVKAAATMLRATKVA